MFVVRAVAVVRHPTAARVYDGEEDVHEREDHASNGEDVRYFFYSVMEQILMLLLIVIVVIVANLCLRVPYKGKGIRRQTEHERKQ
jgi:hypothetical protein